MKPVLIIGAGIAGLSAAITLAERGRESILISSMASERAQSVMAEGGINASLNTKGENDTPEEHFQDTMRAGCDLADPNAVRKLTKKAPAIVRRLAELGVAFNRTETGQIDLRPFGGQKKRRTAFAKSATGKQITGALIQEGRKWEAMGMIRRMSHYKLVKLLVNGKKQCTGCIIQDDYTENYHFLTGNVLLATGGMNGLFGKTTGTTQNTGAATAAAFAAGAVCANLEMIQYHPTTAACSGKRVLISEAARGEGGRLYFPRDGKKWYFMEEKYPELKNLMPRDVVSREIDEVCRLFGAGQVYLDMTEIPEKVFDEKLSDLRTFCIEFLNHDPMKEPLAVAPGIHYFMGGLFVDEDHRTSLRGLYAAGECACQYHGANRLGGNSLLGAACGGLTAANTLLEDSWEAEEIQDAEEIWQKELSEIEHRSGTCSCLAIHHKAVEIMKKNLGIRRSGAEMRKAADILQILLKTLRNGRDERVSPAEQRMEEERLVLSLAMMGSAEARKESRGAHFRVDYPERDDENYRKTTMARLKNDTVEIAFAEIPKEEIGCIS